MLHSILYIYTNYGLTILFTVSIIIIIVLLVFNFISGVTGKYNNHIQTIYDLLEIPYVSATNRKRNNSFSNVKSQQQQQQQLTTTPDSIGERETRRIAEKLTGLPFPKRRPPFLRNVVTNSVLELDCYCDELKIALEYNGRQHYEYTPYFHESKDAFYNMKYRDEMKARLCAQNGVTLIVVPYTIKDIENYVVSKFQNLNLFPFLH